MKFVLDEEHKFAEFWLTNADQDNPEIETYINKQIPALREKGYLPVIYRSGKEDLYEMKLALLKSNFKHSIRKEIEREKQLS